MECLPLKPAESVSSCLRGPRPRRPPPPPPHRALKTLLSPAARSNLTPRLARKPISWKRRRVRLLIIVKARSNQGLGGGGGSNPPHPGGRGATGLVKLPLFSVQPFFPSLLKWEAPPRCSRYYGARNCLMCLFLLLMQQAAGRRSAALRGNAGAQQDL